MTFIDPIQPVVPTPPTHEELLASYIKNSIQFPLNNAFEHNVTVFNTIYNAIYNNPHFTATEIFANLGQSAGLLLLIAESFGTAINTVQATLAPSNPTAVPATTPDGVTLTLNADSTVAITDTRTAVNPTP